MLEAFAQFDTWSVIGVAGAVSAVFLFLGILVREPREGTRWVFFLGISLPVLMATAFLMITTVRGNVTSVTRGPVHWHADFLIYNCGKEVPLKKPGGLSNRIGDPLLHEHGDKRIHVEGVVPKLTDVTLRRFFQELGGDFTSTGIALPTQSLLILADGQTCPNNAIGKLQTFVYTTKDGKVSQRKLEDAPSYILTPATDVPPGDCIVIEFGPERDRTDHVCESYKGQLAN